MRILRNFWVESQARVGLLRVSWGFAFSNRLNDWTMQEMVGFLCVRIDHWESMGLVRDFR